MNKELLFEALFFSMKGSILISSPDLLTDQIFYKSIIIIVDESEEGYTGFILNKPEGYFFIKMKISFDNFVTCVKSFKKNNKVTHLVMYNNISPLPGAEIGIPINIFENIFFVVLFVVL